MCVCVCVCVCVSTNVQSSNTMIHEHVVNLLLVSFSASVWDVSSKVIYNWYVCHLLYNDCLKIQILKWFKHLSA